MKSVLSTWMPLLAQYRIWFLAAACVAFGMSWWLTQPSVPHSSLAQSYQFPVQSIYIQSPSTLVWTDHQQTTLYDLHTLRVTGILTHHYGLRTWLSPSAQPLVALSTDGAWLALATSADAVSQITPTQGAIEIWSLATQTRTARIPVALTDPDQTFICVAISRDGQRAGWITQGNGIRYNMVTVWDRQSQAIILKRQYDDPHGVLVSHVLLNQPAVRILGSRDGVMELRQVHDDMVLYHMALSPQERGLHSCTLSPDASRMVGGGRDFITIHRVTDGQLLHRFPVRKPGLFWDTNVWSSTVAFSPDNRYALVAAFVSGHRTTGMLAEEYIPVHEPAVLWDVTYGQIVQRFDVSPDGARMVAYSPDGQYVVAYGKYGDQGDIRVFRVQPQPPFVQPLCLALGLLLLMLVALPWIWLRR